MVEYIIIELDILRDRDTAMYPVAAENPFDAVNKFYMMGKPPASDHIMVVPKANIFEHCRNVTHTRRLHWRTEIDDAATESDNRCGAKGTDSSNMKRKRKENEELM